MRYIYDGPVRAASNGDLLSVGGYRLTPIQPVRAKDKHPSEDYDATTCRQLPRQARAAFERAHAGAITTDAELSLCGLWRNGYTDSGMPYQLMRGGDCVAQWAVLT